MPQPPKAATTRELIATLRTTRDTLAAMKVLLLARSVDPETPPMIAAELALHAKAIDGIYLDLVGVGCQLIVSGK